MYYRCIPWWYINQLLHLCCHVFSAYTFASCIQIRKQVMGYETDLFNGVKAYTASCCDVPHHLLEQQHSCRGLRLHC